MNTADRILALKLVTDVGDINKQMKGVTGGFKKMGAAAKSWGKAFGGALILSGLEALPGLISDSYAGFRAGEDAARNLGITFANLGLDAKDAATAIEDVSGLALDLGFDDAEVLNVFDQLLGKTGDINQAFAGTQQVMDLVRGKGWSLQRALKFVTNHLGDLDTALDTNRGKAAAWARAHPLEVTAGKIKEDLENIIGTLSGGDWEGAFANLQQLGKHLDELLFGTTKMVDLGGTMGKVPISTGGLIDRFTGIGRQLLDGIIAGLADLGPKVLTVWDTSVASVDWGKAITDALSGVWAAITADPKKTGDVAAAALAVGGAFATAAMAAHLFASALSLTFKTPGLIVTAAVKSLIYLAGLAAGVSFRSGMFVLEGLQQAAIIAFGKLAGAAGVAGVLRAALLGVGASFAGAIVAGLVASISAQWFIDAIGNALRGAFQQAGLDNDLPLGPGDLPWLNRKMGGPASGWTMTGEAGPELLRLPAGSHVFSNATTRGMLAGGDTTVLNVNVTVQAGIGDPVAIGREVDRVLRVYRKRAGIPVAGAMA